MGHLSGMWLQDWMIWIVRRVCLPSCTPQTLDPIEVTKDAFGNMEEFRRQDRGYLKESQV